MLVGVSAASCIVLVVATGSAQTPWIRAAMDEVVSIDNFGGRDLINSPRSLEACLRSGYDPQELLKRDEKSFARRNEAPEVTQMRAEHSERSVESSSSTTLESAPIDFFTRESSVFI